MLWNRAGETSNTEAIEMPDVLSPLTIDVSDLDGRTCVTLTCELDGVSVPPLRDRLTDLMGEQLARDMVLDIGGVTFLDSTALSLFVLLDKRLVRAGQRLTLLNPSPMARRVFQITGLEKVLRVEPTGP